MPVITGYGYIPITLVTPSGDFSFDATPNANAYVINGTNPTPSGGLVYAYDCAGVFELFENDGSPMGFKEIINLPVDFVITGITAGGFLHNGPTLPTPALIHSEDFSMAWGSDNLSSSVPGWDGDPDNWDTDFQEDLYDPFTIQYDIEAIGVAANNVLYFGAATNAPTYQGGDIQTNVLVFAFTGTFESGGPLPPITPIEVGPGEIRIEVPPGTTEVIVEIPGEPTVELPVEPGENTLPLPPGTEVVTITPTGPNNEPGPPVSVPVALEVTPTAVISLGSSSTVQTLVDPSGIYTYVPNQLYDVLYEHGTSPATSVQVDIPRPYGILNFVPEDEDM